MLDFCKIHGLYSAPAVNGTSVCPKCAALPKAPEGPGRVVVGGLDLGKMHDFSALVILEVQDRVARVKGIKTWPHVDYHVVVADTVEAHRRFKMRLLAIDATGVGEPISEMFAVRGVPTEDIKFGEYVNWVSPWGDRERAPVKFAMFEFARACLQHDPPQVQFSKTGSEELIQQLKEQELILGAADHPTYRHPEGRHDDLASAFLMALYVSRAWVTGNGLWIISSNGPHRNRPPQGERGLPDSVPEGRLR